MTEGLTIRLKSQIVSHGLTKTYGNGTTRSLGGGWQLAVTPTAKARWSGCSNDYNQ